MPKEICPAEGLLLEMPKEICPRRWKKPSSQRRFPSKEIAFTNYFLAKGDFHNKAEYTTSKRWSLNWQFIQQDTSTLKKKIFYSQCQRRFAPSFNWNVESNPRNILKRLEQSIYDFTGQQQKQQVPPHSKWTSDKQLKCLGSPPCPMTAILNQISPQLAQKLQSRKERMEGGSLGEDARTLP